MTRFGVIHKHKMTHIRQDFPNDDRTYCNIVVEFRTWRKMEWLWEKGYEAKPHLVDCENCVRGYNVEQLELLARADIGDEAEEDDDDALYWKRMVEEIRDA